ncbi:hypothetical protein B0H13DRAFT_2355105 [Mycena leptocephala]|nr:hypothetical protein B0H13DRAFT_2355105 [Mycena leptocephala]
MASRTFSFDVPGRGRATPWLGNLHAPKARPMDCPILNSAGYRSTHNITNVDSNADSEIATTLSLVTTAQSNQATTSNNNGKVIIAALDMTDMAAVDAAAAVVFNCDAYAK